MLSDLALEELDLRGIGRMLAMTEDAALTALAAMRFGPLFSQRDVFQLPPDNAADEGEALAGS